MSLSKLPSLLLLAVLTATLSASAQTTEVRTFDLERLELNASGVGSSVVGSAELLPGGSFRSSIFSHYSHKPLSLRVDGASSGDVVFERLTLHLMRQYSLNQRIEFALQLPIIVYQSGQDLQSAGLPRLQTGGLSSPIVSARLALLRSSDGAPLDIALQAAAALPFGNASAYARERGFTLAPRLLVSKRYLMPGDIPDFMLMAEVGGLLRPPAEFGGVKLHHQLHGNVGLATTKGDLRGEVAFRTTWTPQWDSQTFELVGGPRYALTENIELIGLGSLGRGSFPGTPEFRVLFGVGFTEGVKVTGFAAPPVKSAPPDPTPVVIIQEKKPEPKPEPKPVVPAPPKVGKIAGVILDAATNKPIPGALISIEGSELPPVGTDPATGKFLTHELKLGVAYVKIAHPDYEPQSKEVTVEGGKTVEFQLSLKPALKLSRFLLSVKGKNKAIAAKVALRGATEKSIDLAANAAEPGKLEVPGGQYLVNVTAEGYLSQTREVQVSDGGEMKLDFALTPEPKKKLVIVKKEKIQILQQVFFATNKARVLPKSFALLDEVVDAIIKNDIKKIRVEGHTDSRGNPLKNLRLSQERAQAVADYLIKSGINADRIHVKGYGGAKPIAPNMTASGRELNRRVEFMITDGE